MIYKKFKNIILFFLFIKIIDLKYILEIHFNIDNDWDSNFT